MARDRIFAKYTGRDPMADFLPGIAARDIMESEFQAISDDDKARIKANADSPHAIYDLRHDAPAEVAQAEKRVEREAAEAAPVEAVSVTVAGADKPAKIETKK